MVRKGSTTKKSASRKSLKKSSSRSHSHASHHTTNSSGFKMFAHCLVCRCKVNINNCKYVMVKGKGSKMRTRIEGVCEKGHKFAQFAKSSGGKSSSKTMKGGAGNVGDMSFQQHSNILSSLLQPLLKFEREHPGCQNPAVDPVGAANHAEWLRLNQTAINQTRAAQDAYNNLKRQGR